MAKNKDAFFLIGFVLIILGLTSLIFYWSEVSLIFGKITINTKPTGIFLIILGISSMVLSWINS